MCGTCDKQSNHRPRKQKSLKRKRNECPENESKDEEPPKCPNPKRPSVKVKKRLTRIEKIMLRIQPPIADRERYLYPYHVNCFLEESERVPVKKPMCGPCPTKRQKICGEGKKTKPPNENTEGETGEVDDKTKNEVDTTKDNNVMTVNGEENDAKSDSTKEEGEEKREGQGQKEIIEHDKAEQKTKKTKKNQKNSQREKRKMKKQEAAIEEVSDSETSIHSNDSEICLVGLGLSKAEKEQIQLNHNSTHTPQDNDGKVAQNAEGVPEATEQENKDT